MTDDRAAHVRALVITTVASLAGVAAAVVATDVVASAAADADAIARSRDAQLTVLAAVVVQLPTYEFAFDEWGGAKDVLYVAFMTFVFWFITLGIVLTTGAQLL